MAFAGNFLQRLFRLHPHRIADDRNSLYQPTRCICFGCESGIAIDGEQRSAAIADFNEDGRPDLIVTENGAETRLFINQRGKPGLRVRLKGPPYNPAAIGASMRLTDGEWQGAVREIHAGSGYWSQDSPTTILATPRAARAVQLKWPGGRETRSILPRGATEVVISEDGSVEPVASKHASVFISK